MLGDSTAQAIGASRPDYGYVGQVRTWLDQRGEAAWRVVNLSRSGATSADVVAEQLAALAELASPDLVSCAVGANDLLRPSEPLASSLRSIAAALPPGSLLANLPRGLREGKAARINALIAELAEAHDLHVVDLWSATGPPWGGKFSADHFHPNDNGYRAWADAFIAAIEH
ncbi:MAG: SGNH/GDSL hydrolase family protein [Acidimicrobiales bacterium]